MAKGGAEAVSLGQNHGQALPPTRNSIQGCSVLDVSEVKSSRPEVGNLGYWPRLEVRRSGVTLWSQEAERGVLLGVRGWRVGRLFLGV